LLVRRSFSVGGGCSQSDCLFRSCKIKLACPPKL